MSATPMQVRQWSEEVARDPGNLAFLPLAEAYRAQGRRDAALRLCIRGLERHPENVEAHHLLGVLYAEGGEALKAFDEWDIALRLSPEHQAARRAIGMLCVERADWPAAVRHLERAAADAPDDAEVRAALDLARTNAAVAAPMARPGPAPASTASAGSPGTGGSAAPGSPAGAAASAAPSTASAPSTGSGPSTTSATSTAFGPPTASGPSTVSGPSTASAPSNASAPSTGSASGGSTSAGAATGDAGGSGSAGGPMAAGEAGAAAGTAGGAAAGAPRWESLRDEFAALGAERGVVGAVLLDEQGYVVAGEMQVGGRDRAPEVAAVLSGASSEAERAVKHLGMGTWRGILLETPEATVRLAPVADGGMLAVAARREVPTGWVLRLAGRARDAAARWLGAGGAS